MSEGQEQQPTQQDQQQTNAAPPQATPPKKSNKTLFIVLGIIGGLIACLMIGGGLAVYFGGKYINNSLDKAGISVGKDKGKVTYKSKDGDSETEVGEDVEVPEGWPEDVPIYEGKVTMANKSSSYGESYSVRVSTDDDAATVEKFYSDKMKKGGWEEANSTTFKKVKTITFNRDNYKRTVTVSITEDSSDEGKNLVSIYASKSKS